METEAKMDQPPYLPDDLISKILVRLPVKILIRFKCVCKSWFSLISDHHFANSNFQLNSARHTRRILFLTTQHISAKPTHDPIFSPPEFKSIALDSLFTDNSALTSPNLNFPLPEYYFQLAIKGSCIGFIFFISSSNFYLWNPSTGVHKQIPLPPVNYSSNNFHGFAYDQSTDDYLVVLVSSSYFWIFSLRANAWKDIVGTTHLSSFCWDVSFSACTVEESLFNGAIHWLAYSHDTGDYLILAFDLMERKLVEIPIPDDINNDYSEYSDDEYFEYSRYWGLWVFRGFLSLWKFVEDKVDIWVMKEYKVQSSWTKTLVLTTYDTIVNVSIVCCTKSDDIVCCAKSGDMVGTSCNGLVRYDDEGKFLEHNYYCKDPPGFRLAMYTESLCSLPNDSEQA